MEKIDLAILISGRGSNMQALINACRGEDFPAQISVVISNRPDASGLQKAKDAGIETAVVDHKDFADKGAFEDALLNALSEHKIDLICLAGFMRILSANFIAQWPDKIINIHPSLLPAYKGLNTHERVLADGGTASGCTVHFVVPEMDAGPTILQKKVDVLTDDTPDTLAARILEQEHLAYPEAVKLIGEKRVRNIDGRVEIS